VEDQPGEDEYQRRRADMVERQIEGRGIRHPGVLAAMRAVPRERFVLPGDRKRAFDDRPLPIPAGQTISQPFVVAYMIAMIEPQPADRVLEIGTGSGYAAAVVARLVAHVHSVERHPELVAFARANLAAAGVTNVTVHEGDGTRGWPAEAPYDGIIVTAGGPGVPPSLRDQLAVGGRLVMPVGRSRRHQTLVLLRRLGQTHYEEEELAPVAFVPLIGDEGWR
jgi:protein-L-isoaspartate(D-aspartate) O-methyltransferase